MSLQDQSDDASPDEAEPTAAPSNNTSEAPPAPSTDATANPTQPVNNRSINDSLKQLDRKQLEAERLARQEAPSSSAQRTTEPQYLDGTIKRTWAYGCARGNDIKLEEVLQKTDLTHLLVSTFNFDVEWWMNKIDFSTVKQTWIVGAQDDEQVYEWSLAPKVSPNISVCLAMKGGNGVYHAKFLIGSHPKYLRIAITTANLNNHDWGESGLMENTVFIIDLPRLPEGQTTPDEDLTPFGAELMHYLKSVGLGPNMCSSLVKFDWSRTRHLAFVHSLAGAHTGAAAQRTGIPGLSRAIKQLNLESTTLELDYFTSSLGALSRAFMKQLITAAKGEEVEASREKHDSKVKAGDLLKHFRVYFPTHDTVRTSKGGPQAGGTITLRKNWYEAASFPKTCMRDHKSTRKGLLSHNKMVLGRGQHASSDGEEDEDEVDKDEATERKNVAWAYIGSHNLTSSAWGTLSKDRATQALKVTCRNYECGVIVPVPAERMNGGVEDEAPGYEVFDGTVEIPLEMPGDEYGDKSPWYMGQERRG
ncbi:phospholipase d nuclease [Neofusicoccum parvum]|uniref:Phospholipase d nuclease n=1 Tax=Neofusicoccum parvum TaxID=310453 RepID=A0ACB5S0M9_9PEZI|nr:phospholipase d nuclease [Neofusicoccum parvum]